MKKKMFAASLETFTGSVEHTEEFPTQSHVHLGVFFFENPRNQPDAKELGINQIFCLLQIITFETETPAGHQKYQQTLIVA